MKSEQINELAAALAKAQGEILGAKKDSSNPFYKSKYSDLSSVWEACRAPLSKNGLSVSQMIENRESGDVLHTMLLHSSGQWLSSEMQIRIKSDGKTNELQALGSCITYLRRFSLAALVGVAPADEDDDGNSYKNPQVQQPQPQANSAAVQSTGVISSMQLNEILQLFTQCDQACVDSVMKHLSDNKIYSVKSMPIALFASVKAGIEKYIADSNNHKL